MERIGKFLQARKDSNLLRKLNPYSKSENGYIYINNKKYADFSSNDYLGLATHPKIIQASSYAAQNIGTGARASRLLSGSLELHHKLEEKAAEFKQKPAALIFNSGYQANVGIISAIFNKEDVIFADKLCHASIIDGIKLSGSKLFRYRHNDSEHLEILLKKERAKYKEALIITESVFSMDGDIAPLTDIAFLKNKYNAFFIVDEAHATGIYGKNGSGIIEEQKLIDQVDIIIGTFGKALGSFGGYAACSKDIRDFLINSARSFIYSTALPPSTISANIASLDIIKTEPKLRQTLLENVSFFRSLLKNIPYETIGITQIVPIIIGQNKKTINLSSHLQDQGYWALPIRPPTVPENKARLRFSITTCHTKETLKKLTEVLYV
ncbi:8-amino-7-oxononanoate synthase [bacterium]